MKIKQKKKTIPYKDIKLGELYQKEIGERVYIKTCGSTDVCINDGLIELTDINSNVIPFKATLVED